MQHHLFTTLLPLAPVVRCEDANRAEDYIRARLPAGYTVDADGTVRRPNGSRYGAIVTTSKRISTANRLSMSREFCARWS